MTDATLARTIAHGIVDARASVFTHVPGYGGTETFAELQRIVKSDLPCSFHEEVAYTVAHGAGLVGARSACLIKTHGFAKATNSILSSLSTGTRGGVIVFAFDDIDGSHSDNVFDAEGFIRGSGIRTETLSQEDPYAHILSTYDRSEALGLPCALLVDTQRINDVGAFDQKAVSWRQRAFKSEPYFNVACPPLSAFQKRVADLKRSDSQWRTSAPPAPEITIPGMLPSPLKETAESYVPFFDAFKAIVRDSAKPAIVAADAGTSGLFAFSPFHCVDFLTCMGGSTSLALGASLAGAGTSWAVTGDFSFISAGHLGLLEAALRRVPLKLFILDNGKAAATGDQKIDPTALALVLKPYGDRIRTITAADSPDTIRDAVRVTHADPHLSILVASV